MGGRMAEVGAVTTGGFAKALSNAEPSVSSQGVAEGVRKRERRFCRCSTDLLPGRSSFVVGMADAMGCPVDGTLRDGPTVCVLSVRTSGNGGRMSLSVVGTEPLMVVCEAF